MRDPRKRTGGERTEIWDRISSGEPIPSIASSFGRYPSAIWSLQLATRGVRPAERDEAVSPTRQA
jgi:hypothetical protein